MQTPLVPFEDKLHAIAYINSNCGAQSGRSDIMRALIRLGDKAKVGLRGIQCVHATAPSVCQYCPSMGLRKL